jgi:hypothetical protein
MIKEVITSPVTLAVPRVTDLSAPTTERRTHRTIREEIAVTDVTAEITVTVAASTSTALSPRRIPSQRRSTI